MKPIYYSIISLMCLIIPAVLYAADPPATPFIRIAAEMHSARITSLASDADNEIFATASIDKTVKLWDASSGTLLRTLRPPMAVGTEGCFNTVAVSPDGKTIAAGGFTGSTWDTTYSVYLFNASTGELSARITGFKHHILRLAYSRDGKRLAVSIGAGGGVHIFSTADRTKIFSDTTYKGHVFAIEFAHNGNLIAASDQGELRNYRPDGTLVFSRINDLGSRMYSISIAPDSSRFAVSYEWESRKEIDILSAEDGNWERAVNGIQGGLQSVAWSVDGNYIFTAGGNENKSGRKILYKWSLESRSVDEIISLPVKSIIRKLLPLENGGIAFISSYSGFGVFTDKNVTFRPRTTQKGNHNKNRHLTKGKGGIQFFKELATPEFSKNHDMFKISPDAGSVLFSYKQYGESKALFDLKKRQLLTSEISDEGLAKPLLTGNGIDVKNWDSNTPEIPRLNGKKLKNFGFGGWEFSSCLAVRPDETGFVIGSTHYLHSYNSKGKQLWKRRITERAWDVNISADSRILVASFDDGTIRWFNMADGSERYSLYLHPDKKQWVLWLPEGYFDHSPGSESLVGFVVNRRADQSAEIIRMSRMYDLFYRPDIVEKAIAGHDISVHLKHLQTTSPVEPAIPVRTDSDTGIKSNTSARKPDAVNPKHVAIEKETAGKQELEKREAARLSAEKAEQEHLEAEQKRKTELEKQVRENSLPAEAEAATIPPPSEEQVPAQQPSVLDILVNRNTLPPHVRFITTSGEAAKSDVTVVAELCDAGGGIGEVTLYLNDMPILIESNDRALKVRPKVSGSECVRFERTVTVGSDKNTLAIMARNRNNTIESRHDRIELTLPTAIHKRPKLHILTVAINRYRDGDLHLKYPINDANELVRIVSEKGKNLFADVAVYRLHDDDVTRQKLETRFGEIAALAGREDVFVLFLAGHGISEERDGMYYFLPVDFRYTDADSITRQGISMNDFKRWLAGVQAMKSLILLDTCNSGAFAEAIASRGITEKTAISKLARAIGRATIAASSKSQVALEGYEGHGVFSYTLIEGIKGKAANNEGQITINRLATFIEETLPAITFKKWGYEQIPQRSLTGNDFPIGILR